MVSPRAVRRRLVVVLVVCVAVLSACAPIRRAVVGPEAPVSRPVPGAARGAQDQAMAYGGGVFLVAWIDDGGDLWVTRVDRNGVVVDQSGIHLSTRSGSPAVAFDGTNFLVVWGGAGSIPGTGQILGRRVSPSGALLDPAPIELSPAVQGIAEVSFGGGSYLVVWTNFDTGGIFGTRLRPDGVVVGPVGVPIVAPESGGSEIDIAFDGTHHLLVWAVTEVPGDPSTANIYGTLVTAEAVAVGPRLPISTAVGWQRRPAVASTGSSFFVAWDDQRENSPDVFGTRVAADGSVLDAAGIRVGTGSDSFGGAPHDVSWDGVNALVTWQTGPFASETITGARVAPSGTLLDPAGVVLGPGRQPASAFDGTNHLVTGVIGRGFAPNLRGTRVTPGLAPLDPGGFLIAIGANQQRELDMASDGVNHLVVWTDNRTGQNAVYGARVGPDGQNLDGAGFLISAAGPSAFTGNASVAFDGTNYLVAWSGGRGTPNAARISRSGEILARLDIPVPFGGIDDLAFGNGMFLVGWIRGEDVMVTRVTIDGTVLDPEGIALAFHLATNPDIDIAAGASEFLIAWHNGFIGADDNVIARIVRLDGTVVPIDTSVAAGPFDERHAGVAWHDGRYLLVWHYVEFDEGSGVNVVSDIRGARVDPSGTVLDQSPLPISTAPGDQQQPDVAANGRFLVTWLDRRRSTGPSDIVADVYATTVAPGGAVGHEFAVGASDVSSFFDNEPVVTARPGSGDFAVAYGRFVPDEPYGATRAFVRRVAPK